jgi:hypothetical protein
LRQTVSGEGLSKAVGIPGCIFCHGTGFLAIHSTHNGAMDMARIASELEAPPLWTWSSWVMNIFRGVGVQTVSRSRRTKIISRVHNSSYGE